MRARALNGGNKEETEHTYLDHKSCLGDDDDDTYTHTQSEQHVHNAAPGILPATTEVSVVSLPLSLTSSRGVLARGVPNSERVTAPLTSLLL